MISDHRSILGDIENYEKLCATKADHHMRNGFSAKRWDNFLVISALFFSAASQLVIPLMVVVEMSAVSIAIASAVLTFIVTFVSRLKDTFNFSLLNYQHLHLSEEFKGIEAEFFMLSRKLNPDLEDLELLVAKYNGVAQRAGVPSVSECRICCFRVFCCFS